MAATAEELYQKIGQFIFQKLPEKWIKATVKAKIIYDLSQQEAEYTPAEGAEPVSFSVGFDTLEAFEELRVLMAEMQPGKGAWYTAVFTLTREGKFDCKFDYENRPQFKPMPEEKLFKRDLERFPRTNGMKNRIS